LIGDETMRLTNPNAAQLELLHAMASIETEEELHELKQTLSKFFALKAQKELDKLWKNGTLDQKKLDELRKQHLRTPYKQ